MARPDAAPVRRAVSAVPSSTASSAPVCPSTSWTVPRVRGMPRLGLSGTTLTSLHTAPTPGAAAAITRATEAAFETTFDLAPASATTWRCGSATSPRARAAKVSRAAAIASAIGKACPMAAASR
nr:hypothetical protein [Plesiocystis pacifica]